jgi:hypothetical protein
LNPQKLVRRRGQHDGFPKGSDDGIPPAGQIHGGGVAGRRHPGGGLFEWGEIECLDGRIRQYQHTGRYDGDHGQEVVIRWVRLLIHLPAGRRYPARRDGGVTL